MTTVLASKTIPSIGWHNMAPPFCDHVYLENADSFPFEKDACGFSLANAWWLSEIALLSYAEESFVAPRLRQNGFGEVRFFDRGSTQCYVAAADALAIVAFRGTEVGHRPDGQGLTRFIEDLVTDCDIRLIDTGTAGRIHQGFAKGLDEIWPNLEAYLDRLSKRGCRIWMTGHSLGGALAVLAAARLPRIQGIHTFGAPRVGDASFVSAYPVTVWRWVNNNDAVSGVPPFPYADLGELIYIDSRGEIHQAVGNWERRLDELEGHLRSLLETLRCGLPGLMPDGLKDHTPLLYPLHIWNNLARRNS